MLTFDRFKALAEAYGADLTRWPAEERAEAYALLDSSEAARSLLSETALLDDAIDVERALRDKIRIGDTSEQAAALARLRAGVSAHIAVPKPKRENAVREWLRRTFASPVGLAASGSVVMAMGLLIGWLSTTAPATEPALANLRSAPFQLLAED